MLFDLRGRGRRRTVQVIYLSLAILMGGGLVLFGIGGATSGGLIDAIQGNSSTTSGTDAFQKRVDALEKPRRPTRRTRPPGRSSPALRFQLAGSGANYDQATQRLHRQGQGRAAPGGGRVAAPPQSSPARSPTRRSPTRWSRRTASPGCRTTPRR